MSNEVLNVDDREPYLNIDKVSELRPKRTAAVIGEIRRKFNV